jgi:hypothetical protein
MATVTESIKESLVGVTEEPQLSQEVRASFMKHAKPDEKGELYMGSEEFTAAIAPAEEDYVSYASVCTCLILPSWTEPIFTGWATQIPCALLTRVSRPAQDKARAVFDPF